MFEIKYNLLLQFISKLNKFIIKLAIYIGSAV